MKWHANLAIVAIIGLLTVACVKTSSRAGSASLNIVNAVNLSNPLITNFTPLNGKGEPEGFLQYYAGANQIGYMNWYESGSYAGRIFLSISQIDDTSANIWSGQLNLSAGSIYSLFFTGDTANVDTLFTMDVIPYYPPGDSVAGVRVVNLVPNSTAMSVNIQGNLPTQAEFSNLGYKQVSQFKSYNANSTVPGNYTFEIRNQSSDSLLAVYTWSFQIFRNQTIVISGTMDNDNYPISPFTMNNY